MRGWPVAALCKVVLPCLSACLCTGWNVREQQLTYYSAIITRVSLTDEPEREVRVGLEILRSLELAPAGASVTSCPTCGRTRVDVRGVAAEVESALERYRRANGNVAMPRVAVMGCAVNGPGEAKDADIALCGGNGEFLLYLHGKPVRKVPPSEAVAAVLACLPRQYT